MSIKLARVLAFSLSFTASDVSAERKGVHSSLRQPSIAAVPVLDGTKAAYFGISSYIISDRNLVLASDRLECERFLARSRKLNYSLNRQHAGVRCQTVNVIEVRDFFLPTLLPGSAKARLPYGK